MLAPDSRMVLLDQLRPPMGFQLEAAVATTFTLDLQAALVPPLSFAAFNVANTTDQVAALSAITSCADRVDIFAQAGQISVPAQANDLMACLEPMIHQVTAFRPGFLFHPKVWILRYSCPGEPDEYRLLCGSRNLTGDRSWDVIARFDGTEGTGIKASNAPIAAFLEALPAAAESIAPLPAKRKDRVLDLANRARTIDWELPQDVKELRFHALGIPGSPGRIDLSGTSALIVSPFCNDEGVANILEGHTNATLVSRKESLDALSPEILKGVRTLVLDPLAGLGGSDDEDEESKGTLLDGLHAKIVVVEYRSGARAFIGSANATSAAYGGNVEFMVELVGGAAALGIKTMVGDDAPLNGVLIDYEPQHDVTAADDPTDRLLQKALREVATIPIFARVSESGGGRYSVAVSSRLKLPYVEGVTLSAALLTSPGTACDLVCGERADGAFDGLVLEDITPFLVFRAAKGGDSRSVVVCATLLDDPAERMDAILVRQVNTPDAFRRFLELLLGWNGESSPISGGSAGGGEWGEFGVSGPSGVLELIVRSLAGNRAALRSLDRIVSRLRGTDNGLTSLPPGFEQLWSSVITALDALEGTQ